MTRRLLHASAIFFGIAFAVSGGAPGHARQAPQAPQGRGGRGNVDLPDGPGKAPVMAYCTRCHQLGNIVASGGYTHDDWQKLVATMVALPKETNDVIVDYLAKNFPELPRPKPVVVAGPVKVSFREWDLPTLGSRPHDPLAARDGSI